MFIFKGPEEWHFERLQAAIYNRWPFAHIVVLTPVATIGRAAWAEYDVLGADVQWCLGRGFSMAEARNRAYQYSTTVETCFLSSCLQIGRTLVSPWRRLCCIGVSNGAIPAFDLATTMGAFGLYLS